MEHSYRQDNLSAPSFRGRLASSNDADGICHKSNQEDAGENLSKPVTKEFMEAKFVFTEEPSQKCSLQIKDAPPPPMNNENVFTHTSVISDTKRKD